MLNVLFYTTGITGTGRLVHGLTIALAFKRKGIDCNFSFLHSSPFGELVRKMGFDEVYIDCESSEALNRINFHSSQLFTTIEKLNPDILLVDLQWFTLHHFIDELNCKKIFLARQVIDEFFCIPVKKGFLEFDASPYDYCFKMEPFDCIYNLDELNPFVMRNHNEILSREEALAKLGLDPAKKHALYAFNGKPGEYEEHLEKYSFLEKEGYELFYSTNYKGGLFPVVDYYNAFDVIVCAGSYNQFWETRYFNKQAYYECPERRFVSIQKRVDELSDYSFTENGADQLVDILKKVM